jgi:hypothetical protein
MKAGIPFFIHHEVRTEMERIKTVLQIVWILGFVQLLVTGVSASGSIPISYGKYVNGTISTPTVWDTYTFNGNYGDPVYLRLKTSWHGYGQLKLYAPNGALIASPSGEWGTELTKILPATGSYTLLVGDDNGDDTGTYDLYLQRTRNPAYPVLIHYGDYITGTIAHPAVYRTYTLNGTFGDTAYFRLNTSWHGYGQLKLYAPNGALIASPSGEWGTELTKILPATGNYTLLVGDNGGDDTGTYNLFLQRI